MIEQRKAFHHQLDEVRDDIVVVAAMVIEVLPRGTEALLSSDLNAADEIIRGDDVIDLRSVDIEDRCFHLLALQQPMASDLRAIIYRGQARRRDRAVGRPGGQHLQGLAPPLRAAQLRSEDPRPDHQDEL